MNVSSRQGTLLVEAVVECSDCRVGRLRWDRQTEKFFDLWTAEGVFSSSEVI